MQRYAWEPWHFGFSLNARSSVAARAATGAAAARCRRSCPSATRPSLARAAQRWNVSAALLAAQIYAESNFNPFAAQPGGRAGDRAVHARHRAGARPRRTRSTPTQAIDAQAHLMRDLLRHFASVPLALAAYNAGPGAVAACMCVPPYPETRGYVARILGLLAGAGEPAASGGLTVRLVE